MKRSLLALVPAAAAAGALLLSAGPAGAAAHPAVPLKAGTTTSTEQFGYRVTGGQFRNVHQQVFLRNAGQYAASIGSYGVSVQLWSASKVIVLGISTCATTDCQTGSPAVNNAPWGAALAVYDAGTHALIHSAFAPTQVPAGHTVRELITYSKTTGTIFVSVVDETAATTNFSATYSAGAGLSFSQARLGAETSAVSPWGPPAFTYSAPAGTTLAARMTGAGLTNYIGHAGTISDSEWSHNTVTWTRNGLASGAVNGDASALAAGGSSFTVSLEP